MLQYFSHIHEGFISFWIEEIKTLGSALSFGILSCDLS